VWLHMHMHMHNLDTNTVHLRLDFEVVDRGEAVHDLILLFHVFVHRFVRGCRLVGRTRKRHGQLAPRCVYM